MMDTAQKQALTKCRVHMVKHLHLGELFDSIKVQEIFTDLTLEDIKESNQSRADRVRALLDYLPRRGPQAFDKFISCLQETRQDVIAHCILEAYLSALGPGEPVPIQYRKLPFPTQASLISGQGHGGDHSIQESAETEMIVEEQDDFSGIQETTVYSRPSSGESSTPNGTLRTGSSPRPGSASQDSQIVRSNSDPEGFNHPTHGYSGNTAEEYRMESEPRGFLLIINNRNFTEPFSNRDGSDVDCDKLKHLFQQLGFGVDVRIDLSAQGIRDCLHSLSQLPTLQVVDSLAVAILTHGSEEMLYGVDGHCITVNDAFEYFTAENCPNLHHKPKLFILNACRGEHEDRGSLAAHTGVNRSISRDVHEEIPGLPFVPGGTIRIPNLKDFLVAYSTIPGHVSWRHLHEGSWFIQALFKVFSEKASTKDVLSMLVKVNHEVAQNINDQGVQIPAPQFMLTKTWYLNPPPR